MVAICLSSLSMDINCRIVIFVGSHSTHFTKFLGSNPIALLATLILLSYTKLFRAILTVMSFTYIQALDGSSIAVWLCNGNIRYLSGKHIPLFMFALLLLLFLLHLSIAFTLISLTTSQHTQDLKLQPVAKGKNQ